MGVVVALGSACAAGAAVALVEAEHGSVDPQRPNRFELDL